MIAPAATECRLTGSAEPASRRSAEALLRGLAELTLPGSTEALLRLTRGAETLLRLRSRLGAELTRGSETTRG